MLSFPRSGPLTPIRAPARRWTLADSVCTARMTYLRGLDTWPTFGKGWQARVMGARDGRQFDDMGVIDRAAAMAKGGAVIAPVTAYTPKTYSAVIS